MTDASASQQAQPGRWAADPAGRHELRWWDGDQWTSHVADGGTTSVDPLPAQAEPQAASDPDAAAPPDDGFAPPDDWEERKAAARTFEDDMAPRGKRVASSAIDAALLAGTAIIGWAIWARSTLPDGQTPGKRILGLRVLSTFDDSPAGPVHTALREIAGKAVPLAGMLLSIWIVAAWAAVNAALLLAGNRMTLWDRGFGTVVVEDPDGDYLQGTPGIPYGPGDIRTETAAPDWEAD